MVLTYTYKFQKLIIKGSDNDWSITLLTHIIITTISSVLIYNNNLGNLMLFKNSNPNDAFNKTGNGEKNSG